MHALKETGVRGALLAALSLGTLTAPALELKLSDTLSPRPTLLAPPTAAPRPASPSRPAPEPTQALIVALTVNAEAKGDRVVRMTPSGEFLVRREDLLEIAAYVSPPGVRRIEGDDYVPLRAIPRAKIAFDEKSLTLAVILPPEDLPPQRFDLTSPPRAVDFVASARSGLVNYRLGYAGTDRLGSGNLSLAAEAAVAYGDWLFRNQSYHSRSPDTTSNIRLETQAIRDDRDHLRRLTLGDNVTPGLVLGAGVPFAGISLSKAYQLEPYLNRHPGAGFRGLADFPSEVDFYVGNTLVLRQHVAPGPFDIQNFSYYGGRRDVRVVIRDSFGRQQTVAYPFYFASQGLAAGLHDYSYQAGWLRGRLGIASNDYGPFAFSAFHQYGFSDAWTLGLRTEGTARMLNAGPDVFLRSESFGLFALHAAASRDRDRGRNGHALSLSHAFQLGEFSSQVGWQRFSRDYAILGNGAAARLPLRDLNASVGYSARPLGSLSIGYTQLQLPDEAAARSLSLSYSRPMFERASLVTVLRRQLSEPRGYEVYVGLQYAPGADGNLNITAQRDVQGMKTAAVSWANHIPQGEGTAYALNAQRQESSEGVSLVLAPRLEWYTRYGTLSGEVTRFSSSATRSTGYSLAMAGAVVAAGGHVMATHSIPDAFAIVEVVPPLAGVRVYGNSQEIGRTDSRGRILLPNIAAYSRNYASIANTDVPIEYTLEKIGQTFSPSLRSGVVVPFRVERLRSFAGRFVSRITGTTRPLEYHLVTVTAGGRMIEIPTAKNGEFYAENLPAGRHPARVEIQGTPCAFTIDVPASDEMLVPLGDIMACDAPR